MAAGEPKVVDRERQLQSPLWKYNTESMGCGLNGTSANAYLLTIHTKPDNKVVTSTEVQSSSAKPAFTSRGKGQG